MGLFHRARREDLASKLERKGSELSQRAAEKGTETSRRVADILRRASDDIRSMELHSYRDRAVDAVDMAKDHVEEHAENARDTIRSRPLTSVAMAVGFGVLAGTAVAMIGRSMAHKHRY
jgi:ElaB/YqjD/DUF883 family membrane-anchored ribosome-binding protein